MGTKGRYTTQAIEDFLRDVCVARLNDLLGETLKTILDLPRYYDELAGGLKGRVADDFAKYGLELVDFLIGAITPPEEVQKMIDERAGMGAIGDMQRYMAFKAARGIEAAANNPGEAGNAAGLGLGRRHRHDDAGHDRGCDGCAGPRAGRRRRGADGPAVRRRRARRPARSASQRCPWARSSAALRRRPIAAASVCAKCQSPLAPGVEVLRQLRTSGGVRLPPVPKCQTPVGAGREVLRELRTGPRLAGQKRLAATVPTWARAGP